ncbi:hypothetical protein Fcan01_26452 [Folsomia candida]|uniref:Uncharacterized protein n=2 Tax=Folsomia candida TaxID=158441 RepID=A0A226D220_FOLCA|nr:hypothetical protein Fcan01_26452 [Folsomia candida]
MTPSVGTVRLRGELFLNLLGKNIPLFFIVGVQFVVKFSWVEGQTFERNCGAPVLGLPGDQFCGLLCGVGTTATCRAGDGLCQCDSTCGAALPTPLFEPTFCPPSPIAPVDSVLTRAQCNAMCRTVCIGGLGEACELPAAIAPPDLYVSVCACYCPNCDVTTVATPTSSTVSLALVPNPVGPFKVKKLIKLGLLLFFRKLVKLVALEILAISTFCWYFSDLASRVGGGWTS